MGGRRCCCREPNDSCSRRRTKPEVQQQFGKGQSVTLLGMLLRVAVSPAHRPRTASVHQMPAQVIVVSPGWSVGLQPSLASKRAPSVKRGQKDQPTRQEAIASKSHVGLLGKTGVECVPAGAALSQYSCSSPGSQARRNCPTSIGSKTYPPSKPSPTCCNSHHDDRHGSQHHNRFYKQ